MLTFSRILIPTDFSRHANQALRFAIAFAERFDSHVTMLHVVSLFQDDPNDPEHHFPELNDFYSAIEKNALNRMTGVSRDLEQKFDEKVVIRGFVPADEILRYAENHQIDVIVMGTHGRAALGHFLMGSVAEKVARRAPCAVMTVAHQEKEIYHPAEIKNLIVPLDFSEFSAQAIPIAGELAASFSAKLNFIHVVDERLYPAFYMAGEGAIEKILPDLFDESKGRLQKFVDDHLGKDMKKNCVVKEGVPHNEIARFADEYPDSMVVMATHGLTGFEKLIIGSTTEKVLRKSKVPVLTFKPVSS